MLTLDELKKNRELVNSIDWEMTPEMAVRLYMEWGNVWSDIDKGYIVRSKRDQSVFFLVNCWPKPCNIHLVKANSQEVIDIAKFAIPEEFQKPVCEIQTAYAPEGKLKEWLRKELSVN